MLLIQDWMHVDILRGGALCPAIRYKEANIQDTLVWMLHILMQTHSGPQLKNYVSFQIPYFIL